MSSVILFLLVLVSHISLIFYFMKGELWQIGITAFVYFLTGCLGMTVTYHRLLSHRSWNAPKWYEYLGTLLGTIGLTGSSISWVAIHRMHHSHTDNEKDPHSPHTKGFFRAHFLSMFEKPNLLYAKSLVTDPFHHFLHRYYLLINMGWGLLLYLIDPFAVVYAYLAPAAILWNAGSSINSFCHKWGYVNFKLNNSAKNNLFFGWFTWGEGWHNNHHRYPERKNFTVRAHEIDIGGNCISLIEKLHF